MAGKMKIWLGALLPIFLLFVPTLAPAAGTLNWEDSSAVTYERLSNQEGLHSDLFILPIALKRSFDRFDLSVTLPYLFRNGNTAVSVVNGWAFRTGARTGLRGSDNGFGDAVIEGNFYALDEEKDSPISLTLTGNVKAPIAPKSRGLGTGKFDEGLGFRFDKDLGESWVVSAGADYTFIGRIPEAKLKDVFSFDAGLFKKFTERLLGVVGYEQSTPLLAGTRTFRDVTMGLNFRATKTDSVFLGGTIETASNPDYGITLSFSSRF